MVKIMENPIKMDDLGENPLFSETSMSLDFKEIQDSVRAAEVTLRAEAKRSIGSLVAVEREDNIWMAQLDIGIIWNWSQPYLF